MVRLVDGDGFPYYIVSLLFPVWSEMWMDLDTVVIDDGWLKMFLDCSKG